MFGAIRQPKTITKILIQLGGTQDDHRTRKCSRPRDVRRKRLLLEGLHHVSRYKSLEIQATSCVYKKGLFLSYAVVAQKRYG